MAFCKRPVAVLDGQGANPGATCRKKRRFAKRTTCCKTRKPNIGTTKDYEETSRLGEGSFGTVVKGRHRVTGQTVAIKFLRSPYDNEEPADASELLREACFLEACNGNPYLVGFHGIVRDPTTSDLGLVMEYVGRSLHDFLRERRGSPPLPEATVRAFMCQLLTGAKEMHERRIIHRDINPANILVGEGDGVVKICDFGLAMSMSEAPPHKQVGTMQYRAPEMLLGKPDYDALVDAWSLGCVMTELITGKMLLEPVKISLLEMLSRCDAEIALLEMLSVCDEEITHLWRIFHVLGMPDDTTWPGFTSLPLATAVPQMQLGQHSRLRELFPEEMPSKDGFEVLNGLLACNPDKRLTAAAALKLPWFASAANSPPPPAAAKVDTLALPVKEDVTIVP